MDVYLRPARRSQRHTGNSSKKLALHFADKMLKRRATRSRFKIPPELSSFRTSCLSLLVGHYCIVEYSEGDLSRVVNVGQAVFADELSRAWPEYLVYVRK